jgi:hypothetical protein
MHTFNVSNKCANQPEGVKGVDYTKYM